MLSIEIPKMFQCSKFEHFILFDVLDTELNAIGEYFEIFNHQYNHFLARYAYVLTVGRLQMQ